MPNQAFRNNGNTWPGFVVNQVSRNNVSPPVSRNNLRPAFPKIVHNNPCRNSDLQSTAVATYPVLSTPESWEKETKSVKRGKEDGSVYSVAKQNIINEQRLQNSKTTGNYRFVPVEMHKICSEDNDTAKRAATKTFPSPFMVDSKLNGKLSRTASVHREEEDCMQLNTTLQKLETEEKGRVEAGTHGSIRERLSSVYDKVRVVANVSDAKEVVKMLTGQYKHLIHACDTEVYFSYISLFL